METSACTSAAGVDVSRDHLDVGVAPSGEVWRTRNARPEIAALIARLKRRGVGYVVLEAIGPYGRQLMLALSAAGLGVGVADPRRIKAWRTAEGKRAKNDRLDAGLIARFALAMPQVVRPVPDKEALKLRAFSTRRRQLVEMIAMEKTRLKQAFDTEIAASHRRTIKELSAQRAHIEADIEARLSAADAEAVALLESAPGVGRAVALTLLCDLPELGTLDRRAIASLAGVAPQISQSGASPGRASIAGGRPCVRNALYLAALSAARSQKGFKTQYLAMREQGKPAKVALIAIARKLLVTLNTMMRERREWRPENAQHA
jgi:transposase